MAKTRNTITIEFFYHSVQHVKNFAPLHVILDGTTSGERFRFCGDDDAGQVLIKLFEKGVEVGRRIERKQRAEKTAR